MGRKKLKLVVIGYAGHGKDTVCEILRDEHGYTFASSSQAVAEEVIFPALKDKYGYTSVEECFADRHNHRQEWFELIKEYNTPDLARLGKLIFSKYDIYCGLRSIGELIAIKDAGLCDYVISVDALQRLRTKESTSSMTVIPWIDDDYVIENNGTLDDLKNSVSSVISLIEERAGINNERA